MIYTMYIFILRIAFTIRTINKEIHNKMIRGMFLFLRKTTSPFYSKLLIQLGIKKQAIKWRHHYKIICYKTLCESHLVLLWKAYNVFSST